MEQYLMIGGAFLVGALITFIIVKVFRKKVNTRSVKRTTAREKVMDHLGTKVKESKNPFQRKEYNNIIKGTKEVFKQLDRAGIKYTIATQVVGTCVVGNNSGYSYECTKTEFKYFMRKAKTFKGQLFVYISNLKDDYVYSAFVNG